MKIGIYFPGFQLESGGGYTFEQEILQALLELSPESRHKLMLYFDVASTGSASPLPVAQNLESKWLDLREYIPTKRIFISKIARKLGLKKWELDPKAILQTAVKQDNIQMVWFSTCNYLPVDIPYIATIWDIQHRLQPWFHEVSQNGEWDYREKYFSSFLQRATYIITPNQSGQDELSLFYQIPPERFRLLPHPSPRIERVPSQEETATVLKKYNLSVPYLFYPAQFWAHKNHVNLLKALAILRETYKIEMNLALTGSNQSNQPYVQSVAEKLGLKERVHFLGFVPREDLIAIYAGAFALSYVTYFGPENLPPLEAFFCGCPVIASDVSGAAEQLGDAALRVNVSHPEEIALAVKQIHDDAQLRASLVEKGFARVGKFTGLDYVREVFAMLDEFEAIRINWE
jgi:glycosyltransferase involved in cell wall biosynthesis